MYPVLYLKYRLETQQEDSGVRHLIVDEMQDYSMIQYLIIQRLFKCKMTILGDREQTMDGDQQDDAYIPSEDLWQGYQKDRDE